MTGVVTVEQLTWIIGVIAMAGGAVAGFLIWVYRIVMALRGDFARQLAELDSVARLEMERAKLVEQQLRDELAAYRIHAAERFATKDGVTQAIGRMESAIEKLTTQVHDAIERITSRMDRILDGRADPPGGGRKP